MTQEDKEKMFLDLNSVLVKFWKDQGRPDREVKIELLERMLGWYKKMGYVTLDFQTEEQPSKDLVEAAKAFATDTLPLGEGTYVNGGEYRGFIAGAKWQKEQDQPITGNSLEQEWLRYVDRKKKEDGGELPVLGDYGWLMIARHFAQWQKSQMLKDAVEAPLYRDGDFLAIDLNMEELGYTEKDKVKIIVVKENEK